MKIAGIAIIILMFVATALFLIMVQPGSSGVVASIQLPDGSQYMVTQQCNWSVEPYTVAFYMRSVRDEWGWCYIDHQADRWRDVSLSYDPASDVLTVTERGTWMAALDRKRGTFAIGEGKPRRELPAPQDYRQPVFQFPKSNTFLKSERNSASSLDE
jgi:hypothetical protein